MNAFQELMVHELREEHHDREWVDKRGTRWLWCEDQWYWWNDCTGEFDTFTGYRGGWERGGELYRYWDEGHQWKNGKWLPESRRGPFMDAIYYRMTRGS